MFKFYTVLMVLYWSNSIQFSSVQSLSCVWLLVTHESQYARPPCPSPIPGVHSNPCPSSQWCHPAISSSVVPFSSCPQSLPASGSFSVSQLFAWGGQSIGVSALASVLPMNTQDWSPLGRKWRGTKKPLDESERGEWKSWLKAQHSENEDHGIWSHHFMGNRWGNSGNGVRRYLFGLQNHCRWWLQLWN